METPWWAERAGAIESWTKVIAIVIGGGWVGYRFLKNREREPALKFELKSVIKSSKDAPKLVSFEVNVANTSKVRLKATGKRPAFTDGEETLQHAVSLLLRPIEASGHAKEVVQWFDSSVEHSPREGDIELDLLNGYFEAGQSYFWMEPGESYQVGASVFLNPGAYLAMLTFVGVKQPDDFWRMTTVVHVPGAGDSKSELT